MSARRYDPSLDYALVALADPTRREILRKLARADMRVTDLAVPFRISLNSVSKHIKLLERAKLVERRRAGREHILRFPTHAAANGADWIAKQEAFWRAGMERLLRCWSKRTRSNADGPRSRPK